MKKSSRKKPKKTCDETIDKISSLPDDILYKILSCVDIVDVVRLSVLSRRWKSLWLTVPNLNFDIDYFKNQNLRLLQSWDDMHKSKDGSKEKFQELINWVLVSRGSTKITSFRISCGDVSCNCFDEALMRWIRVAVLRNVEQLELITRNRQWLGDFAFLNSLVKCESLRVLRVTMPTFLSELPSRLNFKQLTSLYLELVEFTDDHLVQKLLSECSILEDLSLKNCFRSDIEILDISSSSLKCLTIIINYCYDHSCCSHMDIEIRISCPNLVSFTYMGGVAKKFSLDNMSSLDYLCIYIRPQYHDTYPYDEFDDREKEEEVGHLTRNIIEQVENVRVLKLVNEVMQYLCIAIEDLQCFSTQFHRLKFLNLTLKIDARCTQGMFLLLKHCPVLESLTLVSEQIYDDTGRNELWQLPDEGNAHWESHLKSVHFINFKCKEHELWFVKVMLKNALVLEKFIINWSKPTKKSLAATKRKLSKYPKASTCVEVKIVPKCPDALLFEPLAYRL